MLILKTKERSNYVMLRQWNNLTGSRGLGHKYLHIFYLPCGPVKQYCLSMPKPVSARTPAKTGGRGSPVKLINMKLITGSPRSYGARDDGRSALSIAFVYKLYYFSQMDHHAHYMGSWWRNLVFCVIASKHSLRGNPVDIITYLWEVVNITKCASSGRLICD